MLLPVHDFVFSRSVIHTVNKRLHLPEDKMMKEVDAVRGGGRPIAAQDGSYGRSEPEPGNPTYH